MTERQTTLRGLVNARLKWLNMDVNTQLQHTSCHLAVQVDFAWDQVDTVQFTVSMRKLPYAACPMEMPDSDGWRTDSLLRGDAIRWQTPTQPATAVQYKQGPSANIVEEK